ncbi:helix-turn-helix domain-containing protein (plasmid) [Lysinibacillus capsici]|uniref:helix-turn-helix transcriptional regulator n=1 Tax=Lysinibacillus capsici TaxID=2115968 RepID=UPI0021DA3096|nr:helix-turn-helix transcriptional regulator [Lysinibacillus capsici]UYB50136.1 helix-turn-helix domain-containing protein [Lysinibacillus capsici]UYB50210.1 helix-turn-helix domain-containing protein [Lysinibacillus capsici]
MQTNLIQLRTSSNVTQKQLADLIEVDVRTYINKEQGISQFKCNEMFAISDYFKKDVESIFLPSNFMNREVYV